MLSDEEKAVLKTAKENYGLTSAEQKILVNLIEKQSKEIEILNKNMNLLREQNISYKQSIHGLKEMNKIINKKWKDKIKAKIEDILNSENSEAIEKLIEWQSFLEKE